MVVAQPALALEISEVIFKSGSLPRGWVMTNNMTFDEAALPFYEKKFKVKPLLGLSNQFFKVDNQYKLQVNFIQCKNTSQAKKVARDFRRKVVKTNRILQKQNIVIEIITRPDSEKIKNQVTRLLQPANVVK